MKTIPETNKKTAIMPSFLFCELFSYCNRNTSEIFSNTFKKHFAKRLLVFQGGALTLCCVHREKRRHGNTSEIFSKIILLWTCLPFLLPALSSLQKQCLRLKALRSGRGYFQHTPSLLSSSACIYPESD